MMKMKKDEQAYEHAKVVEVLRHQINNHADDDKLAAVECDSQNSEQRLGNTLHASSDVPRVEIPLMVVEAWDCFRVSKKVTCSSV